MPWSYPEYKSRFDLSSQQSFFQSFELPDPIEDELYLQYKKRRSKSAQTYSERYEMPCFISIGDEAVDFLLKQKKQYTHDIEYFQGQQKLAGKNKDIETARFLRDELNLARKYYKATCCALNLTMNDPPGDCSDEKARVSDELASFVDTMLHRASIQV